jgi:Kef-type K+ transport system membrane component KefB
MMMGAVFCNLRKDALHIIEGIERWTPALFMLFFILSGSELDFTTISLPTIGICLIYLVARSCGKYFGARWGCAINKTDPNIKKFLGLTLLPQAGVAIGMARSASSTFKALGEQIIKIDPNFKGVEYLNSLGVTITAVVLCATLVYELFGPLVTKMALRKAGEIKD